jgi:hypothetical protein
MKFNQNKWAASFANNEVGTGRLVQREYFAAIGAVASSGKWFTICDDVWVSAGAGYGPQVEFESDADADEFVKENKGAARSSGTRAPRVDVNSVAMFVKAWKAAKGEVTKAPKAEVASVKQVPTTALLDASLALALTEVEEEEAKAVSPRDAAIAQIKAARPDRAEDEAFIAKVLTRMGL